MADSKIEWTDKTWNPVRGCVKVSPGCKNCFAKTFAERWRGIAGHPYEQGFDLRLVPEKLTEPLKWKKPARIFVNSMSDLFQDGVPFEYIDKVFAVMALTPQHTFQVLTKRADRMLEYCSDPETPKRVDLMRHVALAGRLEELSAQERTVEIGAWPGYFITSKGRVLSDRNKHGGRTADDVHEIKPQYGEQGHARVMLQVGGVTDRLLVHRLVLEAFDRSEPESIQGCHINGNPTVNALWNLKWGTQSENWDDSKRHGTRRRYSKLTDDQVVELRTLAESGVSGAELGRRFGISDTQARNIATGKQWAPEYKPTWPLPSVWLGVSAEDQKRADERIPKLLQTPAAVRFVSYEPALGPVDFSVGGWLDRWSGKNSKLPWPLAESLASLSDIHGIDWIIVGGESGPGARPFDIQWARDVVAQCKTADVAVFVKQLGARPMYRSHGDNNPKHLFNGLQFLYSNGNPLKSKKGGDMEEWPEDLRVRQFPDGLTQSRKR